MKNPCPCPYDEFIFSFDNKVVFSTQTPSGTGLPFKAAITCVWLDQKAGTTYAAADTGVVADTGAEDTDTPPKLLRQNTGPHGHELIAAHLSQTKTEHGSIIGVLGAISAAHKSGAISDQRKAELKESLLSNSIHPPTTEREENRMETIYR